MVAPSFWDDLLACDGSHCEGCDECQPVLWELVTGQAGDDATDVDECAGVS